MASEQLRVEKRVGQPKISAFNSITIYRYEFSDFQLYRYTEIYDIPFDAANLICCQPTKIHLSGLKA